MRKFKQLSQNDRIKMETLLNAGYTKREVAEYLHVHRSTIYREYNKGIYLHRNTDYTESERYSSDKGQMVRDFRNTGKGRALKIENDYRLLECIENKIVNKKYSPEAALAEIESEVERGEVRLRTMISVRTLYRYIDDDLFLNVTNKDLPVKGMRRNHQKRVRVQKRACAGESIENRPDDIMKRNEFGHWEMDTVKGKQRITKSCMLVLTERKTRNEIIVKMRDQRAASVVEALNALERKWGLMFSRVFRTITVDNGAEFADCKGMERSAFGEEQRTAIYYCHPYSSWERGSNENNNKLIRRHIPKGVDFDGKTDEEIAEIEEWMNCYPRKKLGYKTSKELFEDEIKKLA